MTNIPARYRDLFREMILPLEGGYTPEHTNDAGRIIDPETLFGVTINNLTPYLRNLNSTDGMSPEIARRVQSIIDAPDNATATTRTRSLMRYVGGMLRPIENDSNPNDTIPARSNHLNRSNLNATQASDVTSMQNIIFGVYYDDFVVEPGFNNFPDYMVPYLVDFGINGGTSRARWALSKAMREAGIFSEEDTESENDAIWKSEYPYITSSEANDRTRFASGNSGAAYNRGMNQDLIDRLNDPDVTDQQRANVISRFNTWRLTYYEVLARESPSYQRYLNGWNNRTRDMDNYVESNWESGLPDAWDGTMIVASNNIPLEHRPAFEAIVDSANREQRRAIIRDLRIAEAANLPARVPTITETTTSEPAAISPAPATPTPTPSPSTDVTAPEPESDQYLPYLVRQSDLGLTFSEILLERNPPNTTDGSDRLGYEEHLRIVSEIMAQRNIEILDLDPFIEMLNERGSVQHTERFLLRDLLGSIGNTNDHNPDNNTFTQNRGLNFYPNGTVRQALAQAFDQYYRANYQTSLFEEFDPATLGNMRVTIYHVGDRDYINIEPPTTR